MNGTTLYDWRKWNLNPANERKLAEMKGKTIQSCSIPLLPFNEKKKWNAQAMARDSIGANVWSHQSSTDMYRTRSRKR